MNQDSQETTSQVPAGTVEQSSPEEGSRLSQALRRLMERREMNGRQLAKAVEISTQALSSLLNARTRPRQRTFGKLMRALCVTPAEEQALISAYEGGEPSVESPDFNVKDVPTGEVWVDEPEPSFAEELERARRYLEIKAQSVGFEEDVAALLRQAGIPFDRNVRHGGFIAEFITRPSTPRGERVAIECKFNINRDWERTRATAHLLQKHMPCDRVVVVVPYLNDLGREYAQRMADDGATVVAAGDLASAVHGSAK